jgi:hypothetical protein
MKYTIKWRPAGAKQWEPFSVRLIFDNEQDAQIFIEKQKAEKTGTAYEYKIFPQRVKLLCRTIAQELKASYEKHHDISSLLQMLIRESRNYVTDTQRDALLREIEIAFQDVS